MGINGADRLRRDARDRERTNRANSFWDAFLMTENGKVKSTLLIYSFFLSVVFLAVYFAAYIFLLDPINAAAAGASLVVVNLAQSLIPAAVGTAVCGLSWLLFRDKRLMPATYAWLVVMAVVFLITMLVLFGEDLDSRDLFLHFFLLSIPAPLLFGCGMTFVLYRRYLRSAPPEPVKSLERGVHHD